MYRPRRINDVTHTHTLHVTLFAPDFPLLPLNGTLRLHTLTFHTSRNLSHLQRHRCLSARGTLATRNGIHIYRAISLAAISIKHNVRGRLYSAARPALHASATKCHAYYAKRHFVSSERHMSCSNRYRHSEGSIRAPRDISSLSATK